jgi:hypothetical protein
MQALCGATKMQLLGDGDKVTKMSQLDIPIHIQKILIQQNKILDVINAPEQTAVKAFLQCDEPFNGGYEQLSLAEAARTPVASVYTVAKNAIGGNQSA